MTIEYNPQNHLYYLTINRHNGYSTMIGPNRSVLLYSAFINLREEQEIQNRREENRQIAY